MPSRTKHRSIQVPAKIGRPTKYSPEWAEGFCALIAEGQSVAEICERRDQPSQQSVYTWLRENEDFLERYARAREAQADLFFKECLEIADRGKDGENESQARIQRDRLRVDTRKWMAARLAPKKYGDHISHDVKGGGIGPKYRCGLLGRRTGLGWLVRRRWRGAHFGSRRAGHRAPLPTRNAARASRCMYCVPSVSE